MQTKEEAKIKKVKKHLQEHGSITSWEAIKRYNYTRLSDGIYKLRKTMNIKTVMHYKNGTSYAEYVLVKENEK